MDHLHEGGSTTRPPPLEGTNYSYWKVKMRAFIKSQKEEVLKPENQWNTEEEKIANYNSNALNAIFSAVDVDQFKLIATCDSAKEAWTALQTTYEGTAIVMEKSETIVTFNAKLCDIANEAQALGEKYSNCKLERKALRSLPERFTYKVTPIEEACDIEKMKLDELMGSLQIFELNLNHNRRDKQKSIAFQAEVPKSTFVSEDNDDMSKSLALVTNFFGKFLKIMDENSNKPKSGKSFNSQKYKINFNSFDDRKNKRIQCYKYEGFGHIQAECVDTLKRMGKSLTITWSDEESKRSQKNDHTAFCSKMMNNHREHIATNQRYVPTQQARRICRF
ncbi:hypothetical protein Pfo_021447 [Paulownia fortunei]|nr:hypothetical protein Pfo_021447 [Paulownia fortunei]